MLNNEIKEKSIVTMLLLYIKLKITSNSIICLLQLIPLPTTFANQHTS